VPPPRSGPQVDWGDALDVPVFYGRAEELALLTGWVVTERCRMVSVLGLGGIGKSAFTVTLMRQVAAAFEVVIWRSLRDAPACGTLLDTCLQVLDPQALRGMAESLDGRLDLLMEQLRDRRVLLVLDNLEVLLEDRSGTGRMRAGFAGYARLLQRVGETAHQSCLLLTSRENPSDLIPLEGSRAPVRALRLAGLDRAAGDQLLSGTDVVGTDDERIQLIERYQGNPLALKLVAQAISELFGGDIDPFLAQGELIFGSIRALLGEQFGRLSTLEQHIFFWLAIMREPVSPGELQALLSLPTSPAQILETLNGLSRRSLTERGPRPGSVTLQSVVLEYATARLIEELGGDIAGGRLDRLHIYALCHAQTQEYVRRAQEQLLLAPLLGQLRLAYPGQAALEAHMLRLLDELRGQAHTDQGYAAANLVALLGLLRKNLRGLDLSRLALRGLSLQGVELQDADLSGALVQDSLFTEGFGPIRMVAISQDGQRWAAGSRRGEIWVWGEAGRALHHVWQAHPVDMTALVLSSDGERLASAGFDGTVKLWDVERGSLLWTSERTASISTIAFRPDGRFLASGGGDGKVSIWDAQSGGAARAPITLRAGNSALAWSPDGRLLACGRVDGQIEL
ncbi:MAG: XRE family transcriptional regulator, partial [Chloroflexales bacterium]|nr:XRE family transcriptional regulator [Chloroflexales bacterium]